MKNPYIAIGPTIIEENGNRSRFVLIYWPAKKEYSVHEELFDSIPVDPQDNNGSLIDGQYFNEVCLPIAVEYFADKVKTRTAAYLRETMKITVKVV